MTSVRTSVGIILLFFGRKQPWVGARSNCKPLSMQTHSALGSIWIPLSASRHPESLVQDAHTDQLHQHLVVRRAGAYLHVREPIQ